MGEVDVKGIAQISLVFRVLVVLLCEFWLDIFGLIDMIEIVWVGSLLILRIWSVGAWFISMLQLAPLSCGCTGVLEALQQSHVRLRGDILALVIIIIIFIFV
jgi:hypothetical protein